MVRASFGEFNKALFGSAGRDDFVSAPLTRIYEVIE